MEVVERSRIGVERRGREAMRLGAEDQAWGEGGGAERKKCRRRGVGRRVLVWGGWVLAGCVWGGGERGFDGGEIERGGSVHVRGDVDRPLIRRDVRIRGSLRRALARRSAFPRGAGGVVQAVDGGADGGRQLRGGGVPVLHFGVGVAEGAGSAGGGGGVEGAVSGGVEGGER